MRISKIWGVFLYYWFDQGQVLLWSKGKNEIIGPELLFEKNRIDYTFKPPLYFKLLFCLHLIPKFKNVLLERKIKQEFT